MVFEYLLGQVGAEGVRWGQTCLCVSIAANMDKVPSGGGGGGGGGKAFDSGESRWIENQYK